MLRKRKQFNINFKIDNDEIPSRFVIDLKEKAVEKDAKKRFDLYDLYEKYGEINVGDFSSKYVNKIGLKTKDAINILKTTDVDKENFKKTVKSVIRSSQPISIHNDSKVALNSFFLLINYFPRIKAWFLANEEKIKSLAIYSFLNFIFLLLSIITKTFYKISFNIGWAFIFIIRFLYFSSLHISEVLFNLVKIFVVGARMAGKKVELLFGAAFKALTKASSDFAGSFKEANTNTKSSLMDIFSVIKRKRIVKKEIKLIRASSKIEKNRRTFEDIFSNSFLPKLFPQLNFSYVKSTMIFTSLLIFLIIPFKAFTYYKLIDPGALKGRILGVSEEAIDSLLTGGQLAGEFNFEEAQNNFSNSANKFFIAQEELNGLDDILRLISILPNEDLKLASESKNILEAGQIAAELGNNLSIAVNNLVNQAESDGDIGAILDNFLVYSEKSVKNADNLAAILTQINPGNIPENYRQQFIEAKEKVQFLAKSLAEFNSLVKNAQVFLGAGDLKRYLLIFQNNSELRATGGFLGSFALVDFANGKMKNMEIPEGGSYDTEGGLLEKIVAPEPLHLVNPLWHFWDANWWPDWPTSAEKLMWFYERSGGPTVDGVISITPTVLERILAIIGPVDMTEKYGVVITSENFREITREIIDETNRLYIDTTASSTQTASPKPKAIIGDLTKKIIEEFPKRINKEVLLSLMKEMELIMDERHALFYFTDSDLQDKIEEYGWDGSIKQTSKDYLSVINTNISGGKSDRKIKETINHEVEILSDGTVMNTVEITRFHDSLKFVDSSGVRNVNWMRIYVPLGSKLIEARGFEKPDEIYFEEPEEGWQKDPLIAMAEEDARTDILSGTKIYEEFGKTVFANWSMVDPGQTITIYLKYQLPFKLNKSDAYTISEKTKELLNPGQKEVYAYSLLAQKQAGINSEINTTLKFPEDMSIIWCYPDNENCNADGWSHNTYLNTDKYWAVIIQDNSN